MMKFQFVIFKINFCFLVILSSCPAFTQSGWPPVGAEWHYSYTPCSIDGCNTNIDEYIHFKAVKDTLIHDTLCTQVHVAHHDASGNINHLGAEYMYSTEDQVFNYHHGRFNLLYDFSLNTGDSIYLQIDVHTNLYERLGSDVQKDTTPKLHIVTEKDSIWINNKKSLVLLYEYEWRDGDKAYFPFFHSSYIVKGIGSLTFLTGDMTAPIEFDIYGPLRCYSDSTITYSTDVPCDAILTQNKPGKDIAEEISFLQTNNQLTIIMHDNALFKHSLLQIYDMQGRIVLSEKLQNAVTEIPFQDLHPDIYIANIVIENERIFTRKMTIK